MQTKGSDVKTILKRLMAAFVRAQHQRWLARELSHLDARTLTITAERREQPLTERRGALRRLSLTLRPKEPPLPDDEGREASRPEIWRPQVHLGGGLRRA